VRARDWGETACPSRRPGGAFDRRRLAWRGSRGASTIEYGLLIVAVCAVLCVTVGVAVKTALARTVTCFMEEMQGTAATDPACVPGGGAGGGGGGAGGGGGGGGGVPLTATSGSSTTSSTTTKTTTKTTTTSTTTTTTAAP
jgi:Flp pilus assembly pilin Flp